MAPSILAGFLYFVLVFAAGFAFGTLRVLVIVPIVGDRAAELIEFPMMLVISFLSARWLVRRLAIPPRLYERLAMGTVALVLLLAAEFGLVLWLRGISLSEYFTTRDPLTGTIYYAMLFIFGAMPLILMRTSKQTT